MSLAFAMIKSAAARKAAPPTMELRAANVPRPKDTWAVSPWMYWIASNGTPSHSDTSCANAVSCPCPCECVPGDDRDLSAGIEPQFHAVIEHATEFDVRRDRTPAKLSFTSTALSPRLEALPVGDLQATIHHPFELTAVVEVASWRLIRQGCRFDDVASADLDRV